MQKPILAHNMDLAGQNKINLIRVIIGSQNHWRGIPVRPFLRNEILVIFKLVLPITEFTAPKYLSFKGGVKLVKILENYSELLIKVIEDNVQ